MERQNNLTAPTLERRDLGKVMDDIVQELGEVETKVGVWAKLTLPEAETRLQVRRFLDSRIASFRRLDGWHSREGRAAIAESAQELAALVAALEAKLNSLPEPLADYLLFVPWQARYIPDLMDVADEIVEITRADHETLLQRLDEIRRDCERQQRLLPESPAHGPEQDRAKKYCVDTAYALLRKFSRQKATGTSEGALRTLATLVFEDFTGDPGIDLKHFVDRALRARPT
jgi:hypothetical protein